MKVNALAHPARLLAGFALLVLALIAPPDSLVHASFEVPAAPDPAAAANARAKIESLDPGLRATLLSARWLVDLPDAEQFPEWRRAMIPVRLGTPLTEAPAPWRLLRAAALLRCGWPLEPQVSGDLGSEIKQLIAINAPEKPAWAFYSAWCVLADALMTKGPGRRAHALLSKSDWDSYKKLTQAMNRLMPWNVDLLAREYPVYRERLQSDMQHEAMCRALLGRVGWDSGIPRWTWLERVVTTATSPTYVPLAYVPFSFDDIRSRRTLMSLSSLISHIPFSLPRYTNALIVLLLAMEDKSFLRHPKRDELHEHLRDEVEKLPQLIELAPDGWHDLDACQCLLSFLQSPAQLDAMRRSPMQSPGGELGGLFQPGHFDGGQAQSLGWCEGNDWDRRVAVRAAEPFPGCVATCLALIRNHGGFCTLRNLKSKPRSKVGAARTITDIQDSDKLLQLASMVERKDVAQWSWEARLERARTLSTAECLRLMTNVNDEKLKPQYWGERWLLLLAALSAGIDRENSEFKALFHTTREMHLKQISEESRQTYTASCCLQFYRKYYDKQILEHKVLEADTIEAWRKAGKALQESLPAIDREAIDISARHAYGNRHSEGWTYRGQALKRPKEGETTGRGRKKDDEKDQDRKGSDGDRREEKEDDEEDSDTNTVGYTWDHSNSQYGLLGVSCAMQLGFQNIPNNFFLKEYRRLLKRYRDFSDPCQRAEKGSQPPAPPERTWEVGYWEYITRADDSGISYSLAYTPSMTARYFTIECLGGLQICERYLTLLGQPIPADLKLQSERAHRGGKLGVAVGYALKPTLRLHDIPNNPMGGRSDLYRFYSIERTSHYLGLDNWHGLPWYEDGARILINAQNATGGWDWLSAPYPGNSQIQPLREACWAILFLNRASQDDHFHAAVKEEPRELPPHERPSEKRKGTE